MRRLARCGQRLAGALLAACQQAPLTRRQQLILLPESRDAQLGLQAYQQILDDSDPNKI